MFDEMTQKKQTPRSKIVRGSPSPRRKETGIRVISKRSRNAISRSHSRKSSRKSSRPISKKTSPLRKSPMRKSPMRKDVEKKHTQSPLRDRSPSHQSRSRSRSNGEIASIRRKRME